MAAEEESERPRAVTIIGWFWVVVAVLLLSKALVNLAIWSVLEPAAPQLFGRVMAETPGFWLVRPMLDHLKLMMTAQALWWIAVGISASGLLRLRPWARAAMEGVAWALVVYVILFSVFWLTIFSKMPLSSAGGRQLSGSAQRTLLLVGGLGFSVVLTTALIAMILPLRSAAVRQAFHRAGAERKAV